MSYSLAIKNRFGNYDRFTVDEQVYIYVRQLENAINTGNTEGLHRVYPERFGSANIGAKEYWQEKYLEEFTARALAEDQLEEYLNGPKETDS